MTNSMATRKSIHSVWQPYAVGTTLILSVVLIMTMAGCGPKKVETSVVTMLAVPTNVISLWNEFSAFDVKDVANGAEQDVRIPIGEFIKDKDISRVALFHYDEKGLTEIAYQREDSEIVARLRAGRYLLWPVNCHRQFIYCLLGELGHGGTDPFSDRLCQLILCPNGPDFDVRADPVLQRDYETLRGRYPDRFDEFPRGLNGKTRSALGWPDDGPDGGPGRGPGGGGGICGFCEHRGTGRVLVPCLPCGDLEGGVGSSPTNADLSVTKKLDPESTHRRQRIRVRRDGFQFRARCRLGRFCE